MLITKAPYRISFLGGGSDYPSYLNKEPGLVVGCTINKYSLIISKSLDSFFDFHSRIVYFKTEHVQSNKDIKHKAVRETLKYFGIEDGVEVTHFSDLPGRCGLGSSSAFISCLVRNMSTFKRLSLSKYDALNICIDIEQNKTKENVGYQDSIWSVFGGINVIRLPNKNISEMQINPLSLPYDFTNELRDSLLLIYTQMPRSAHKVSKTYTNKLSKEKRAYQKKIVDLAEQSIPYLSNGDIPNFGRLIGESWKEKRQLSDSVTNDYIDGLYNKYMEMGCYGGKLLGAGGGGCLLMVCNPNKRQEIINRVDDLIIDFDFDYYGTRNVNV